MLLNKICSRHAAAPKQINSARVCLEQLQYYRRIRSCATHQISVPVWHHKNPSRSDQNLQKLLWVADLCLSL